MMRRAAGQGARHGAASWPTARRRRSLGAHRAAARAGRRRGGGRRQRERPAGGERERGCDASCVPELPSAADAAAGAHATAATPRSMPSPEARSRCASSCRSRLAASPTRRASCRCARTCRRRFARNAEAVEAAYRDYRELAISRDGLKRIYVVTLSFALLMALFVAVAVAVTQSNLLAEPLANLAQATQAVARGDFSQAGAGHEPRRARRAHRVVQLHDAAARRGAARRRVEPRRARGGQGATSRTSSPTCRPACWCSTMSSGCPSRTTARSRSSAASSRPSPAAHARAFRSQHGEEQTGSSSCALKGTGEDAARARLAPAAGDRRRLRRGVRRRHPAHPGAARHGLGRSGAAPRARDQESAHADPAFGRAAGDEARRAPVRARTPRCCRRSTETIVNQVAALKAMVDDFSEYARMPAPRPRALDLNALVREVLALYENSSAPIATRLADRPAAGVGRRRAAAPGDPQPAAERAGRARRCRAAARRPAIEVRTELAGDRVRLAVTDNGGGFPEELMARSSSPTSPPSRGHRAWASRS